MRRLLLGLAATAIFAACDKPDEVYHKLPGDYDPDIANGFANLTQHYNGSKGFEDETLVYDPGIATVEVCSDSEIVTKQRWMVEQPIVPMQGAGGLDMRGRDEDGNVNWSGLTVDEVQDPDVLCQALYYADGIAAWGDYYELIAFWDTQTREIYDVLVRSGYKGTLTAGEYVFEINEPIMKGTLPLSRGDGSSRDARSEDNMRAIDRELIRAFRPAITDPDSVDCVEAGSCYIIMSGTLPILVFMSVDIYIILEPIQWHIVQMEIALKRPLAIGMGSANVVGVTPTISGTTAAGIPDCEVTFGTDWAEIEADCMVTGDLAMSKVTSVYGYEYLAVEMGGVYLYFTRPGLAVDEIIGLDPVLTAGDTADILSLNAAYEGNFSMPYSEILGYFKTMLDAAIRAEIPSLPTTAPTGVEKIRVPGDPLLPADVDARYPDRLRPGGIYAAFCEDDGNSDGEYDSCQWDSSGRPTLPLVMSIKDYVSNAVGSLITPKLSDPSYYVSYFERAMGQYFNGGTPLSEEQINFSPSTSRPDRIYAVMLIPSGGVTYTVGVYYGGNDDRIHFVNFQRGTSRMEDVLFADAGLSTPYDPPRDTFTLIHILNSPRMGLGAQGTITWDNRPEEEGGDLRLDTRRAVLSFNMGGGEVYDVLVPFLEASSLSGYWVPLAGPHWVFQPADFFQLYGPTVSAAFYLAPVSLGAEEKEVVAITSGDFFGDVYFCGFPVRIGDYADDLLDTIEDAGYPCELIVARTENREFISSLTDVDSQMELYVANNMIYQAFAWLR